MILPENLILLQHFMRHVHYLRFKFFYAWFSTIDYVTLWAKNRGSSCMW